jgi:hypothetical protein
MTANKIVNKVFNLLKANEKTRDDDRQLIYFIWQKEMDDISFLSDPLDSFRTKKLSHPETIRRARQSLQEKYPSLRGQEWEKRHKKQESFLTKICKSVKDLII